jgi:DNA replication protein DnaD
MPKDDLIGLNIEKTVSAIQNILKRNRSKQIKQQIDLVSKIIVLSLKSNDLSIVQNILNLDSEDK